MALPTDINVEDKDEEDAKAADDEFSSEEDSDYTDSEDDDGPRLKPVFVRK